MYGGRTKAPRRGTDGRKTAALGSSQRVRCYCYSCYTCYSWSLRRSARARAPRSEQTNKANATTRRVIAEIQRAGKTTLAAIAQELEARGVRAPAQRVRSAAAHGSRVLAPRDPA